MRTGRYGWVIDKDFVGRAVGTMGPHNIAPELQEELEAGQGSHFALYDDDHNLYYEGRLVGDFMGFEPLDDFGMPHAGCTGVKMGGSWL